MSVIGAGVRRVGEQAIGHAATPIDKRYRNDAPLRKKADEAIGTIDSAFKYIAKVLINEGTEGGDKSLAELGTQVSELVGTAIQPGIDEGLAAGLNDIARAMSGYTPYTEKSFLQEIKRLDIGASRATRNMLDGIGDDQIISRIIDFSRMTLELYKKRTTNASHEILNKRVGYHVGQGVPGVRPIDQMAAQIRVEAKYLIDHKNEIRTAVEHLQQQRVFGQAIGEFLDIISKPEGIIPEAVHVMRELEVEKMGGYGIQFYNKSSAENLAAAATDAVIPGRDDIIVAKLLADADDTIAQCKSLSELAPDSAEFKALNVSAVKSMLAEMTADNVTLALMAEQLKGELSEELLLALHDKIRDVNAAFDDLARTSSVAKKFHITSNAVDQFKNVADDSDHINEIVKRKLREDLSVEETYDLLQKKTKENLTQLLGNDATVKDFLEKLASHKQQLRALETAERDKPAPGPAPPPSGVFMGAATPPPPPA